MLQKNTDIYAFCSSKLTMFVTHMENSANFILVTEVLPVQIYLYSWYTSIIRWSCLNSTTFALTLRRSDSFSLLMTREPMTGAQERRVNTLRMNGSLSPCLMTMLAICITGSLSGSGKTPTKIATKRHCYTYYISKTSPWDTLLTGETSSNQ